MSVLHKLVCGYKAGIIKLSEGSFRDKGRILKGMYFFPLRPHGLFNTPLGNNLGCFQSFQNVYGTVKEPEQLWYFWRRKSVVSHRLKMCGVARALWTTNRVTAQVCVREHSWESQLPTWMWLAMRGSASPDWEQIRRERREDVPGMPPQPLVGFL